MSKAYCCPLKRRSRTRSASRTDLGGKSGKATCCHCRFPKVAPTTVNIGYTEENRMETADTARASGMPPSPTLQALAQLAQKIRRTEPSAAFGSLLLFIPWLKTSSE